MHVPLRHSRTRSVGIDPGVVGRTRGIVGRRFVLRPVVSRGVVSCGVFISVVFISSAVISSGDRFADVGAIGRHLGRGHRADT